jgi:FO synthase
MEEQIQAAGRTPRMRTTLYADATLERRDAAFAAAPLAEVYGASAGKLQRSKRLEPMPVATSVALSMPLVWAQHTARDSAMYESVVLMAACN